MLAEICSCDRYRTTPGVCALTPLWLQTEKRKPRQHGSLSGLRSQRPDFREAKTDESSRVSSKESFAERKFQKSTWTFL